MKRVVVFLLIALCIHARAQDVKATADKEQIAIGEQFRLLLQAGIREGQDAGWFVVDSPQHFEILHAGKIDTQRNGNDLFVSQVFTLTSWDSGKWQIPSFTMGKLRTEAITVNVVYSPSPFNTEQPYHDIKDIIEVKKPTQSKWHWYVIGVLVLIVLFYLFFPKEKKKPAPAFVPDEGAYSKALRQLDELKAAGAKDVSVYYTELVNVFREYLHRRKNIQSFSKTSDDLAIQAERLKMDREGYQRLLQALRLSDLAKFARFEPNTEENNAALETIRESIVTIENLPHAV